MSVADAIAAIGRGRAHPALLENARLETGGGEGFGQEAILSHFARHPLDLTTAAWIETPIGFAAVSDGRALFGDLYDGRIARLWRLDPVAGEPPEAAVSVAFDPDLTQQRQEVFARPEDHPGLGAAAFEALVTAGRSLVTGAGEREVAPYRARAWLIRAFSSPDGAAGLFSTYIVGDEPDGRSAGHVFAAALASGPDAPPRLVRDGAGEARRRIAPWRPRLGI